MRKFLSIAKLFFLLSVFFVVDGAKPICGDNKINKVGEQCDGDNLGGATCQSLSIGQGTLSCSSSCTYNTSGCVSNFCGDGIVLGQEDCDGSNLNGQTCSSQGFSSIAGGVLSCFSNCTFNTQQCIVVACGNNFKESSEQCDGSDLDGKTCASLGWTNGSLSCDSSCSFNTSSCTIPGIDCFTGVTSLINAIKCYEANYICYGCLNSPVFPTLAKRTALNTLVKAILSVDNNCSSIQVPFDLVFDVHVKLFLDQVYNVEYCVVSDFKDSNLDGRFDNGFLFLAVPQRRWDVHRRIHFQAPHTGSDIGTAVQNVKVFQEVGAQSVLVTGSNRNAYQSDSSTCQSNYFPMDAAHDNKLAFHEAFIAAYQWAVARSQSPWFIQLHGMASSTCGIDIFISHGTGTASVYTATGNKATLLANHINTYSSWVARTPATDGCTLRATDNIQGRIVNGVAIGTECSTSSSGVTTKFFSIEQKSGPRAETQVFLFDAVRTTFETDCAPGRVYSSTTKMCV